MLAKVYSRAMTKTMMLAGACIIGPTAAWSQAASPANAPAAGNEPKDADEVGDIIVTAQKRSERQRDVPLSITAASGDDLVKLNITSPEGLVKITPGFSALTTAYGTPVYTIRGIGFIDVSVAGAPAVSVYVDQVPLPFSLMSQGATLDLERVEVLKGPQGTLFGQNSTGGAINYIAAKPTKLFEAGGDVTYGRFNRFDVNAFISGPITDTLRVRISARSEQRGNWQRSYTRADGLGKRDFLAGRILVDWSPSDRLNVELNVNGWRDRSDTVAQQILAYLPTTPTGYPEAMIALSNYPPAPRDPRAADWDKNTSFQRHDKFRQASLRGDWHLSDALTLSSISAISRYDPYIPADGDGTDFLDLVTRVTGTVKSWSQELRLAGDEDRLRWMIGGNYEHDISRERDDLSLTSTNSGVGPFRYNRIFIDNRQNIRTAAVFGSADYKASEKLTAQVSARYTDQHRDFNGCLRDTGDGKLAAAFGFLATRLSGVPVLIAPGSCVTFADTSPTPVPIVSNSLNQNNLSWRGSLNYKPDRNSLIYVSVARGYKAGGYSTLPGVRVAQYKPAVQERVIAYELGAKASFLGGRAQLDAAVFYYDYADKQIRGFVNTGAPFGNLAVLVNIPKSDLRGAEANFTLRPVKALTLVGGASYVKSRVRGSYLINDQTGLIVDAGGEPFPSTPKWQLNGDLQHQIPLSAAHAAFVGAHVTYRTATTAFFGGNPFFSIPGYTLLDLRAGVQSSDANWRLEVFGDNVTNKFYINNVTRAIDDFSRIIGMPATYGVRLSYRYR